MVKVLIATLLVGVAIWLYLRSQGVAGTPAQTVADKSKADADAIAATPDGGTVTTSDGTTWMKYGGILFNTASPTDSAAAARRLDAINRANNLESLAASQGMTVDQTYQAHLAQSLAAQQQETAVVMNVASQRQMAAAAEAAGAAAAAASNAAIAAAEGQPLGPQPTASPTNVYITPAIAPGTSASTAAYVTAIANAGPKTPPPQPGMTWNYTTQQWEWAL